MRFITLAACLAFVSFAQGDSPKYKIQLKLEPDLGKSLVHQSKGKTVSRTKILNDEGKLLKDIKEDSTEEIEYTYTLLALNKESAPVKYKRFYKTAKTSGGKNAGPRSYQGRTVLFEKRDGKFHVSVEGKPPLAAKYLKYLVDQANDKSDNSLLKILLPKKATRVGDTWTVPAKLLASELPIEFEIAKAKAEGKLLKVYKKGEKTWGIMEWKLTLPVNKIEPFKFNRPVPLKLTWKFEGVIDGSSATTISFRSFKLEGKGLIDQKGLFDQGGKKNTFELFELSTETTGTEKQTEKK
jgi:hypothetical protein